MGYGGGMGYGISRLHGALCKGTVDGIPTKGTSYFQKVCVQAPSIPWFWGMLHFDDGSYIDWFLPHLSPTITARDSRPWKKRDITHFENAIKKHRFIKVNKKTSSKKLGNNLKKWPNKSSVGKWYQLLKSPKGGSSNQVNSSSGNPDGSNELMDQDHEQTN